MCKKNSVFFVRIEKNVAKILLFTICLLMPCRAGSQKLRLKSVLSIQKVRLKSVLIIQKVRLKSVLIIQKVRLKSVTC